MPEASPSPKLDLLLGTVIVADLASTYVCIGTLAGVDDHFLELTDADLHDFRDSRASRETYVYDSLRVGIRRNRKRVLVSRADVIAVARLEDVIEA